MGWALVCLFNDQSKLIIKLNFNYLICVSKNRHEFVTSHKGSHADSRGLYPDWKKEQRPNPETRSRCQNQGKQKEGQQQEDTIGGLLRINLAAWFHYQKIEPFHALVICLINKYVLLINRTIFSLHHPTNTLIDICFDSLLSFTHLSNFKKLVQKILFSDNNAYPHVF